jgi:hypothetical protein
VRRTALALAAAAGLTLALTAAPTASATRTPDPSTTQASSASIHKEALPVRGRAQVRPAARTLLITNHGGPVMTASTGTNAYVIWYGAWAAGGKTILTDFLSSIGGSPYFGINTTYTDTAGARVANKVTLAGQTTDPGTATTLSDAGILTIVSNAITSGRLPKDTNGVYFVLTAAGVTESSGFLTKYCGWHSNGSVSGSDIKYSFVGDPTGSSLASCAQQTTASPNGNPGVDGMTSVIAHELEESVTDPDLNAWYDSRGNENGDKCAWTFGTTYAAAGGGLANMKLGARDFLIQRNWKAGASTAQGCFLS